MKRRLLALRSAWPIAGLLTLLGLALLAPILANELPLTARTADGGRAWPAFRELMGGRGDEVLDPNGADLIATPWPHGPRSTDLSRRFLGPRLEHPCGTDDVGRDVFARLLHGTRAALWTGLGGALLALLIGLPLGLVAGGLGGWWDRGVQRLQEVAMCMPALLLVLAAAVLFGRSPIATVVVLGSLQWVAIARLVRGELLGMRGQEFVLAARLTGSRGAALLARHLLPQVLGPTVTILAFLIAQGVVVESSLAFLGLGPVDTSGSWGGLLAQGLAAGGRGAWHLWLFPSIAMVGTVLCCHGTAEYLRIRSSGRNPAAS